MLVGFVGVQALALAGAPPTNTLTAWSVIPLLGAALAASAYFTRRIERRPLRSLGLRGGAGGLADLGAGALVGLLLIGAVVVALGLAGWVSWGADTAGGSPLETAMGLAALLLGAAFVEELLFRGYPFQVLERRFGALAAVTVTSLAFGALHGANPNVAALPLLNITFAGVLLGVAYWRTRSLWYVTGIHLGWNWVMAVSELSVSGLELEMPGFEPRVTGPALLTGGAFGPEGGLLVTAVSLLGVWWMWRLPPRDESLSPAEPMGAAASEAPTPANLSQRAR